LMNENELNQMKEAYIMLYKTENMLRHYISSNMQSHYGQQWFHIAPRLVLKRSPSKSFNQLLFHEYERIYLRTYPEVFSVLSRTFYYHLHTLYPLRNKVAHFHCLNDEEMAILSLSTTYVKEKLK
jgi:hypothetical protein